MIIVPKKTGKPRRVIDFTRLNRHCKRSVEHSAETLRMSTAVPAPKTGKILFSTLDAWNGYHSIPLTEDSRKYFGFQTDWGCYRYKVAPQGFLGSGDHYVGVYNSILAKLYKKEANNPNSVFKCFNDEKEPWTRPTWKRCIDDTLLWATTERQSFMQIWKYLQFLRIPGNHL